MNTEDIDEKVLDQLQKLQEKYDAMGQDLSSYLDGLLYSNYLTYWDYIHLDTLLSLQTPKTDFPDEKIFIIYHQITELYFRLVLSEMEQMEANGLHPSAEEVKMRMQRLVNYFEHLCNSFEIMVSGMEKEQFLKFRMSLLPSSGFQSGQYRFIEVHATDMVNLTNQEVRDDLKGEEDLKALYEHLYWKSGATELSTGKKTLTLRKFEDKYRSKIIRLGKKVREVNLWKIFQRLPSEGQAELKELFRSFDQMVNVNWNLSHLKAAAHYLQADPKVISATGGTNWQKYLPPRFQKVFFFPDLWSEQEKEEWGRQYVKEIFSSRK